MEHAAPSVAVPAAGPQPCAEPQDVAEKLAAEAFALPPQVPPEDDRAALTPQLNDRIMVVKPEWMERILRGDKTMEVRAMRACRGPVWLGHEGKIYGRVTIMGNCVHDRGRISQQGGRAQVAPACPRPLYPALRLALASPERLPQPLPYWRPGGAIGWNRYRASKDDVLRKKAKKGDALKEEAGEPGGAKPKQAQAGSADAQGQELFCLSARCFRGCDELREGVLRSHAFREWSGGCSRSG